MAACEGLGSKGCPRFDHTYMRQSEMGQHGRKGLQSQTAKAPVDWNRFAFLHSIDIGFDELA